MKNFHVDDLYSACTCRWIAAPQAIDPWSNQNFGMVLAPSPEDIDQSRERMMQGTKTLFTALAMLAVLASQNANAAFMTVEPDDFAVGTNVSNVSSQVSLATFRKYGDTAGVPTFGSVFVSDCTTSLGCASITGSRVFGDAYGGIDVWGGFGNSIQDAVRCFRALGQSTSSPSCDGPASFYRFNVMLMTFTDTTDLVEISGAFAHEDDTYLYGFDSSFNLVGGMSRLVDRSACRSGDTWYCETTVSLTSSATDIRYVLAGGWSNGSSLDNLRFNVPEPGTLALFALGLVSMGFARRNRARRLVPA